MSYSVKSYNGPSFGWLKIFKLFKLGLEPAQKKFLTLYSIYVGSFQGLVILFIGRIVAQDKKLISDETAFILLAVNLMLLLNVLFLRSFLIRYTHVAKELKDKLFILSSKDI